MLRRVGAAVLLLVPLVLLVRGYGGLFVGRAPAVEDLPEDRLAVAVDNVWFRTAGVDHVVDLAREHRPDLRLVSEVTTEHVDERRVVLADAMPNVWFGRTGRFGGVGVLSRHPIDEVRPVPGADDVERPIAVVVVEVPRNGGTRAVQVVPVHLVARCPVCRPFVRGQQREVRSRRARWPPSWHRSTPTCPPSWEGTTTARGGPSPTARWSAPALRILGRDRARPVVRG